MKFLVPIFGLILIVAAFGGGYYTGNSNSVAAEPGNPAFDQGVKTGQLATVVQLINQSTADPCRTINLFNKSNPDNQQEVNLINITCEGLNLPDINEAVPADPQ